MWNLPAPLVIVLMVYGEILSGGKTKRFYIKIQLYKVSLLTSSCQKGLWNKEGCDALCSASWRIGVSV